MTKEEALEMLDNAPGGDGPSRVNRSISKTQGIKIIRDYIETLQPKTVLKDWMEMRVHQVCKDQRRPRY